MNPKLIEQLKIHEGFSAKFYLCTAGKKTIAYGRNVIANPSYNGKIISEPVSKVLANEILIYDINVAISSLIKNWKYFSLMPDSPRKDICINMTFNMGINTFMKFKKLHIAIENNDWNTAAEQMKDSAWYSQVGKRSKELEEQMVSGKYK